MPLLFSVIIPVYRDWDRLANCLEALERQTLPADRFEVVVVDNEPGGVVGLDELPSNARLLHEPTPGSYCARNTGVAASLGTYLAFTDSDCLPEPEWLENGSRLLARRPDARVTGPIGIFREEKAGYFAYLYDFHTAFNQLRAVETGRCATANLMVSRATFDGVGPFNAALVSGGDSDWGDRATEKGVPLVYDEGAGVMHPARSSLAAIIRKKRRVAGSDAVRADCATWRYVLGKLVPPLHNFSAFISRKSAPKSRRDWLVLFLIHWATRFAEAYEFLAVRLGWKKPNRT